MQKQKPHRERPRKAGMLSKLYFICLPIAAAILPSQALADEGGVSVWLPGTFGSQAATQQAQGWSLGSGYYHTSVWGGGSVAAAKEITIGAFNPTLHVSLSAKVNAQVDIGLIAPTYVFATPVLGAQAAIMVTAFVGGNNTNISGTLTTGLGPRSLQHSANGNSATIGFGDLYPQASLRWADGVNNFMTYTQLTAPSGSYQSDRLANIGANHWAIDGGGGYTYFDKTTGREASAVAGFTYNFQNPATHYQNGVDFHLDAGASQFLNPHIFVGVVGYYFNQVTADSGAGDKVGGFYSRVAGLGPQAGYMFSIAGHQAVANLKAYGEFAAQNRPSGWNCWLVFSTKL